ncbi:MAG TPA: hypothetical protein VFG50_01910 [Rhodothermales bacterium]|nr:hypothetical protein [Rhodothermales bacterium]
MTQEEFDRLKEDEKAHLRKLKELKQALFGAQRVASSRQALEDMSTGSQNVIDEHAQLVDRLSQDAALSEARMDMALSAEGERANAEKIEEMEEDLRKARAQDLIRRMREQMASEDAGASAGPAPAQDAPEKERSPVEKTIGRRAEQPESSPEAAETKNQPEKTIGRMRP